MDNHISACVHGMHTTEDSLFVEGPGLLTLGKELSKNFEATKKVFAEDPLLETW